MFQGERPRPRSPFFWRKVTPKNLIIDFAYTRPPAFNKKREIFVHSENFVCNYDNRAKLYIANIAAIRYNIFLKEWVLAKKNAKEITELEWQHEKTVFF